MDRRRNTTLRCLILIKCLWIVAWRCFIVGLRGQFGKPNRQLTTNHLHLGGIEVLKAVKANLTKHFCEMPTLKAHTPIIFMSNHLSLFDLPLIVATIPGSIRMVIKKELLRVPFLGKAALASEQVIVDRNNKSANKHYFYQDAKKKLESGIRLWAFPEGTRSKNGQLLPFKLGVFRLAEEMGAVIIPVGIIGTNHILAAGKTLPHLHQSIEIHVGNAIDTTSYRAMEHSTERLAEKIKESITTLITQSVKNIDKK